MVIVADSYMGMFSPEDIPYRITRFIAGSVCFPFIKEDEIIGNLLSLWKRQWRKWRYGDIGMQLI